MTRFNFTRTLRSVALTSFAMAALTAAGQTLPPDLRGECPVATPVTLANLEPKAPAYRNDIDLAGTEQSPKLRIFAWRVPCSSNGTSARLFLRLTTGAFGAKPVRFPRVTVVQYGRTVGAFNAQTAAGTDSARFSLSPATIGFSASTLTHAAGPLVSTNQNVPFDALAPFTLFVRPAGWAAGDADVRIDIPAVGTPGNHGHVPTFVAGQWFNPDRPGWGLTLARNERETLFAAWLTFDDAGESTWFVMPYSETTADGVVSGAVYSPRGRPFGSLFAPPGGPTTPQMGEPIGRFSFRFLGDERAEFMIDIQGVQRTEPIQHLRLKAADGTSCDADSGVWYDAGVDGWGIGMEGNLQKDTCFTHLTFLTFNAATRPVWYFAPMGPTSRSVIINQSVPFPSTYRIPVNEGALYRPRGPAWRTASAAASTLGNAIGLAETPKFESGAGLSIRIGGQEVVILPQKFRFEF